MLQLSEIRHRGSLSSIFPAYSAVNIKCVQSKDPIVLNFPASWLGTLFDVLQNTGTLITRRSAGLPMAFGAILIGNIQGVQGTQKGKLLELAFSKLFELAHSAPFTAQSHVESDTDGVLLDLPQVHALNCLKFLFMDSKLAPAVDEYIARAISTAVRSFSSEM